MLIIFFHLIHSRFPFCADKYSFLLYFLNFLLFLERFLEVRIVSCNRHMQTPMLHYLKGLHAPFCFSSKKCLIPFCSFPKGISYTACEIQIIRENNRVLHAVVEFLHASCKGSLIAFRYIYKCFFKIKNM